MLIDNLKSVFYRSDLVLELLEFEVPIKFLIGKNRVCSYIAHIVHILFLETLNGPYWRYTSPSKILLVGIVSLSLTLAP